MSAEPTAEQIADARRALGITPDVPDNCLRDWEHRNIRNVARALAAAVTAEREKYLRVADELQGDAEESDNLAHDSDITSDERTQYEAEAFTGYNAARRIREVSS